MNEAAVVSNNALVLDTAGENVTVMNAEESKLGNEVNFIVQRAEAIVVASDIDVEDADLFLKQIKQAQKQVEGYWEPMRKYTYDAYKSVTDHKKEMLDPLKKSESIVKSKVDGYLDEQKRKFEAEEEERRRQARERIDHCLSEAAEAEANGDSAGAEYAMAEAEMMEAASVSGGFQYKAPKVKGVSHKTTWALCEDECDWSKVPVSLAGIVLRPVDKDAVLRLIQMSKGQVEIPGIKFREAYTTRHTGTR